MSFHLIPVYAFPNLLAGMSPKLKARMQGKSCFNFKSIDDELLGQLADLTARGAERFQEAFYTAAT